MDTATRKEQHVRWFKLQCATQFLIAAVLLPLPFYFSEFLMDMFFFTGDSWTHRPESDLKEFFLSSPYRSSYRAGLFLGILPSIFAAAAVVGLWDRRDWGRVLALAFPGLCAFAAVFSIFFFLPGIALINAGGPDFPAGMGLIISAMCIGGALCVLVLSFRFLWYLSRPAIRERFEATDWRKPVAFIIAMTVAAVVVEVVSNRRSVYNGEAEYQGKSTGDWLTQLASSDVGKRKSAVEELGKSRDSVSVICEIYRGRLVRGPRRIYPDGIQRVYWSRAHAAPEIHRVNMIGEPLILGLTKLSQDSEPDIREGAIRSLSSLYPEESRAVAPLVEALRDDDPDVRGSAVISFSHMDLDLKKKILPHLVEASNDPRLSRNARAAARKAISHVESTSVPLLVKRLNSDNSEERRKAAWRLGLLGQDAAAAVPALRNALSDLSPEVRTRAATALGRIGPSAEAAIPDLIRSLEDQHVWTRNSSAFALGMFDSMAEPAVPILTEALKDNHISVRVNAAIALLKIGHRTDLALPVLRAALNEKRGLSKAKIFEIREIIEAETRDTSKEPNSLEKEWHREDRTTAEIKLLDCAGKMLLQPERRLGTCCEIPSCWPLPV